MVDFLNFEERKKLDPKNVYESTGMLAKQCEQILNDARSISIPAEYRSIKNIVLCGMGGSAYGGYVANKLYKEELKLPFISNNDYSLPGFVSSDTLVIVSSYSGSTEEVLACGEKALEKKAKVVGLTSGGKLKALLASKNIPVLSFTPTYNPSGQPRLGTGYMVLGFLLLLQKLGLIPLPHTEVKKAIEELKNNQKSIDSTAYDIAQKIKGSIPLIIAAEFLEGNAHILRNQFNETSKSFSAFEEIPELNHHLMEGLKNPEDKKLIVLFLNSLYYSPIHEKRMDLTRDVVEKNNIPFVEYNASGSNKLSNMLTVLSFGGYLTYHLAILYKQDPSLIPWVDYFKEKLKK